MSRTAGIYTRISLDRAKTELGVKRQEKDCRALAKDLGVDVVEIYTDNDRSASKRDIKRPEYDRMWQDLREGRIDSVLAYHPDRLYRRLKFLEDVIDTVEPIAAAGRRVEIHTVSGEIDLRTPTGRFTARLFGSLAQYEAERLGERVLRKRRELTDAGKWTGGYRPFGFDVVQETPQGTVKNARLVVNKREAAVIRSGVTQLLNGASENAIARQWNQAGLLPSGGDTWNSGHVRALLLRPQRGIVSQQDTDALVRIFKDPARQKYRARGGRYLLTGLAVCGVCGARMVGRPSKGVAKYICHATGKVHLTVTARALDEAVTRAASRRYIPSPKAAADPSLKLVSERDRIVAEQASLGESDLPLATIDGRARKLQRDLEAVEEQLAKVGPAKTDWATMWVEIEKYLADPKGAEDAFYTDPTTRAWLETLLDGVKVAPASRGANSFDPRRAAVSWRDGVMELEAR